jgi:spore coat protein U-like protein
VKRALGLAALILIAPAAARAASCTVTANPVAFGVYLPFSATPANSTGSVMLNCRSFYGTYTIALNAGLHGGGSFSNRRMSSGGSFLSYQLYTDAAHTMVWGDGTSGSVIVSAYCYGSCTSTQSVYGRLPALQVAAPGSYADTTTVTVSY